MSTPVDYAISHARLTIAALAFLLLAGFVAYVTIPKESEPDIKIPRANWVLNKLADLELWFGRRPRWFSSGVNLGSTYVLKAAANVVAGYNLYTTVCTARYDYQHKRNGTANIFMLFAPLEGWRHVEVTQRRT